MAHWEHGVQSLLRPSEHLLLILEGSALRHDRQRSQPPKAPTPASFGDTNLASSSPSAGEGPRVILAIVGHKDHATGESGSVFLYTEETASTAVHGFSLSLQRTLPIHGDFSLEISQLATSSTTALDLSASKPPVSSTETGFAIQLCEGEDTFTMATYYMERLSSVALACRRLRDLALRNSNQAESYRWLEPYTLHPASWLSVKPPRDLRNACQPVHTHLSLGCAGMPVGDTADYVKIRDDWLWSRSQSLATARQGSEEKQLIIRLGTFNVNGKLPSQDLSTWLVGGLPSPSAHNNERKHSIPPSLSGKSVPPSGKETEQQPPKQPMSPTTTPEADMLVVAFQELDLSTEALFYSVGPAREDAWTAAILAALGEKAEQYEKLVSKQLVGILLIVFVKRDLRDCFSEVRESSVAVGIMGVMANKGAVAVRLNYQPNPTSSVQSPIPVTLTFVNSHLAAFYGQVERRNTDFHDISRRLEFGPCTEYVWNPRSEDIGVGPPTLNVYASDVLFWLGDLNYRLNLPDADVRHFLCVEPVFQGIPALLQFDQLRSSIRQGKAFLDFGEYPIAFLPTYRFNATMQTDALGYDTKRTPAWTDRILYKSSPFVPVSQRSYNGHPSITMSDHKPISAEFLVGVPCIDSMVLDMAANDLYKSTASFDPEDPSDIPLLKLDKASLEFGKVFYSTPASQHLSIRNVGKVPAAFRFLPRDLSSPIHPRWLKIEPVTGFLLPEEEKTLQLTIFVSHAAAAPLNLRIQKLSTLLIVHTLLGQDLFLWLDGEYEPSCFGTSLSALARLPGPIRELRGAEDLLPEAQAHNSPREIMKLIGWLMSHDIGTVHDLFVAPGDEGLATQMRESLDTGTELPPHPAPTPPQTVDPNYARTVATVLLELLRSLPEPVVPFSLHQRCAEVTSRDAAFEMLSLFPKASVNVWISVTAFLHLLTLRDQAEIPGESLEPRPSALNDVQPPNHPSRAEILASILAPVLLRDDIDAASPVSLLGKKNFLLLFMEGP